MWLWFLAPRDGEPSLFRKLLNAVLATALVCGFFLLSLNRITYHLDFS